MIMTRLTKGMLGLALLIGSVSGAGAFSLLGPFKVDDSFEGLNWQAPGFGGQPQGLGYSLQGDIGGPMTPLEAYRWNVPIITYAFDFSFLRYFGPEGVNAVEEAIQILNDLPPASSMSENLTEFPLDTKGENPTAAALGLLDLKSYALAFLLEEMGLANPERFVWGLRGRESGQGFTNYTVIQLNYDPVTIQPSRYVNGVLYNYQIFDDLGPIGDEWASAVEWYQLDPLYQPYTSVAGAFPGDAQLGSSPANVAFVVQGLTSGQFFSGLTRDDVGGLRFLLSPNHMVFDTLLPTVLPISGGAGSSPWAPYISTNVLGGTNLTGVSNLVTAVTNQTSFVQTALRPGVDKIEFQRVGIIGTNFSPITRRYTDRYINPTNGRSVKQRVERLVLQPDIIFAVTDLGALDDFAPVRIRRTDTSNWTNNAALNSFIGGVGLGGPGTITPPVTILFSDMVPYFINLDALTGDIDALGRFGSGLWGSFDGTDRPPTIYPIYQHPLAPGLSLEYLQDVILGRNRN